MRSAISFILAVLFLSVGCQVQDQQTTSTLPPDTTVQEQVPVAQVPHFTEEQMDSIQAVLESSIDTLFTLCQKQKTNEAAARMLYSGRDKKRKWKDVRNPTAPKERTNTEKTCTQIRVLLETSENQSFSRLFLQQESEGNWYVCEMIFYRSDGTETSKQFAFLPVKGKFCLGDLH